MPALSALPVLDDLAIRSQAAAGDALQVVCAWPLSGQYGLGSRLLYYVLVAACVFARKREWLRNACLAAALVFPAVAAIHGIVLASIHVNGAVDMDIYGAFQLCSIGILAAPLTVRLSRTYFYDPGRNIIFLWTLLILAGLLGLTVEFYRATPTDCGYDDAGQPIARNPKQFPYGKATCGMVCSPDQGPQSPMRQGPSNDIGVIPIPSKLTFNTGMLLAAACCIPAILSLMFTWDKILEINWKMRHRDAAEDQRMDELIEGTNGATVQKMKDVNSMVRFLLGVIEIPLFGGAVLAILCIGEINFFSAQVMYQTEEIASIGQWAPIAGTSLAAIGSLYVLLTKGVDVENAAVATNGFVSHCNCSHHIQRHPTLTIQSDGDYSPREYSPSHRSFHGNTSDTNPRLSNESRHTASQSMTEQARPSTPADPGGRRRVAEILRAAGDYLGSAADDRYDTSAYNHSRAREFPEIPGEERRNPELSEIRRQYSQRREAVLREEHSRAGSSAASISSHSGIEGGSSPPLDSSPFPESTRGRPQARRDTLEVPSPAYHRT
ncbi:hypothetical protein BU26DRAFT_331408 [Trematosphaeria pertusa]|uniref:Uncharacterized protein n=1 Tax=Trematosphaeria pertusa TaxID=390896 RepID=A0A6A6ID53_9PLEO|nr:uncharacterized protein BU26DRAFT_331408 [Trematosphaeria pertusa]KAF2248321.1 hypothetical protein BU26DRAFT_331408 [Trematosphaeria pertusa]